MGTESATVTLFLLWLEVDQAASGVRLKETNITQVDYNSYLSEV